jgi:hypothetical protein
MTINKKKSALEGGKGVRKATTKKKGTGAVARKKPVRKATPKKAAIKKKTASKSVNSESKPRIKPSKIKKKKATPVVPFKPGNMLWELRSRAGPRPKFEDPLVLWNAAVGYFNWAIDNPIIEQRIFLVISEIKEGELRKIRAFTFTGLCQHIGICTNSWQTYKKKELFKDVCQEISDIIYEQKFTGAAAGVLNANFIARDLNLVDRREETVVTTNKPRGLADFYKTADPKPPPIP